MYFSKIPFKVHLLFLLTLIVLVDCDLESETDERDFLHFFTNKDNRFETVYYVHHQLKQLKRDELIQICGALHQKQDDKFKVFKKLRLIYLEPNAFSSWNFLKDSFPIPSFECMTFYSGVHGTTFYVTYMSENDTFYKLKKMKDTNHLKLSTSEQMQISNSFPTDIREAIDEYFKSKEYREVSRLKMRELAMNQHLYTTLCQKFDIDFDVINARKFAPLTFYRANLRDKILPAVVSFQCRSESKNDLFYVAYYVDNIYFSFREVKDQLVYQDLVLYDYGYDRKPLSSFLTLFNLCVFVVIVLLIAVPFVIKRRVKRKV